MKLWTFLKAETDVDPLRLLAMAAAAGFSNALLLAIVNAAAERADDRLDSRLLPFAIFIVVLAVYIAAQRFLLRISNVEVERVIGRLRTRMADLLRNAELLALELVGRGHIYSVVSRDTQTISQAATPIIVAINSGIMLLFTAIYIATLSLPGFLVTVAVLGVALMVHLRMNEEVMRHMQIASARENSFFDALTHLLDGFKEVKMSSRRSEDLFKDLSALATASAEVKATTGLRFADHFIFSQSAFYILLAALVFALPSYFSTLPGSVQQITSAILFIVGPLSSLIATVPTMSAANVAVENITQLEGTLKQMHLHARDRGEPERAPVTSFQEIAWSDVRFAYRDRDGNKSFEVGPINLRIRQNDVLFIVGGNGSGKSTFLKLLTGLYYPDEGQILIDGTPVHEFGYTRYRNLFSAIFSDYHLFDRLYGVDAMPEQVEQMLEEMQLAHKTQFAEGRFVNQDLSTGQRKRLALIVSLLENRPIDVFDEWAADQDPAFRQRFYTSIVPELKRTGHTVIAATHDDRYFGVADRVFKMDNGQLTALTTQSPVDGNADHH